MQVALVDLVQHSLQLGGTILGRRTDTNRKESGQFLTPAPVARFMAQQLGPLRDGDRILDPGIGAGTLACAVIERVIQEGRPLEIWLDGYDTDKGMCQAASEAVGKAVATAAKHGITVHAHILNRDFVADNLRSIRGATLWDSEPSGEHTTLYDHIIANPPYFKLNASDPRVKLVSGYVTGHTNIYTLFMSLGLSLLAPMGRACFIVPRSFCSGVYFTAFRRHFMAQAVPLALHLFESRQDTFDAVLQENVVIAFRRRRPDESSSGFATIAISSSNNGRDLQNPRKARQAALCHFLSDQQGALFFRIPTGELDEQIIDAVDSWRGSLGRYELEVSTGPVVAFRANQFLMDSEAAGRGEAAPLLWLHNVRPGSVVWPVSEGDKPQAISVSAEAAALLLPTKTYVLVRRFSAKEEPRRLIAAPLLPDQISCAWLGLENHLNYIHRKNGQLKADEAVGLAALLNSAPIDRYVRIANGNTQINAAELRALPLPPLEVIEQIGRALLSAEDREPIKDTDAFVFSTLRDLGYLPPDFPTFRESRITMGKIQEAQDALKELGLPPAQQNEMSALTLLVLAQLSEETVWSAATAATLRIHDILLEIKERYGREYAENTRETVRRQVIHQFEQAGLVERNLDDPSLPTNSPRTRYVLPEDVIKVLRLYGTPNWQNAVASFAQEHDTLIAIYEKKREQHKVPVRLADGSIYHLSPGEHNKLQAAVVEEFGPRFAPGARLLYLGDTENKALVIDETGFTKLGVPVPSHDKLPDIVLFDERRNWLFLVEAVTSHGPISPKRHLELEEMFAESATDQIYVTAFPDFATFKSFLSEIAWDTEVWLAEMPSHLIHFNGDRFLGPR